MGREQSGRGGLPPQVVAQINRLLARDERLSDRRIAERTGVSNVTVWRLRRGQHHSQTGEDRRGNSPARVRLALELLGSGWPVSRVARLLNMHRRAVRAMRDGYYITQRWERALK